MDVKTILKVHLSEYIQSGFTMSISSFKSIENKHDLYRRKDCMKKFGLY